MRDLISINGAAKRGINRLRRSIWVIEEDHLKIDILDGKPGPWLHLYSPFNEECNGRDPVNICVIEFDIREKCWLPYMGPLPESDEYKSKKVHFKMGAEGSREMVK